MGPVEGTVDISALDEKDWVYCLDHGPKLVISARDMLIQITFLHRVYFTPVRMSRMYPGWDPHCPQCRTNLGTYLHMFLDCPALSTFWSGIFNHLNIRLELSVPVTLELALLGIHEDEQRPHHSKRMISYLCFYAKK